MVMNNDSPDNSCYEVNIIACRKRKRRKKKKGLQVSPLAFDIDTTTLVTLHGEIMRITSIVLLGSGVSPPFSCRTPYLLLLDGGFCKIY